MNINRDGPDLERLMQQAMREVQPTINRVIGEKAPIIMGDLVHAALAIRIRTVSTGTTKSGKRKTHGKGKVTATSRSVRSQIAGSITARQESDGVWEFNLDEGRMPPDKAIMDRLTNARHWRHPVFGNTKVWVEQASTPWFKRTARRASNTFIKPELERALAQLFERK